MITAQERKDPITLILHLRKYTLMDHQYHENYPKAILTLGQQHYDINKNHCLLMFKI